MVGLKPNYVKDLDICQLNHELSASDNRDDHGWVIGGVELVRFRHRLWGGFAGGNGLGKEFTSREGGFWNIGGESFVGCVANQQGVEQVDRLKRPRLPVGGFSGSSPGSRCHCKQKRRPDGRRSVGIESGSFATLRMTLRVT
jgi:hypothetical protein